MAKILMRQANMAENKTKLYLELQMEELKATYGVTEEEKKAAPDLRHKHYTHLAQSPKNRDLSFN
jgi:hypothetical protein